MSGFWEHCCFAGVAVCGYSKVCVARERGSLSGVDWLDDLGI